METLPRVIVLTRSEAWMFTFHGRCLYFVLKNGLPHKILINKIYSHTATKIAYPFIEVSQ
jgi:hypothetical protein